MKILITFLLSMISSVAFADMDSCLKDALTNSNHFHAVNPSTECADLIKASPEKVELLQDGYQLYGIGHMFYVEKDGVKELMAGDQTELENILAFEINLLRSKIVLLQENSVSTYRLNFVGNVAPERLYQFQENDGAAKRAKLLDEKNAIAIFRPGSVEIIDANSDSRFDVEALKPKVLNRIEGENSGLRDPIDIAISDVRNEVYVLDSNRILVFKATDASDQVPLKTISVVDSQSIKLRNGSLVLVKSTGEEVVANLTN